MPKKKLNLLLFSLILFFSCSTNKIEHPKEIEQIINTAGSNKAELQKVIAHYSSNKKDTLKLKSAYFLIANMEGLYYYEGEQIDQYLKYLKLIKSNPDEEEYISNSFKELYDPFDHSNLKKQYDLEHVKAEDLIENIEMAFKVWGEQPWGKDISFDQFCNYILPFRIRDEIPEYNRDEIYKKFNPLLDSIRMNGGNVIDACTALTNKLRNDGWLGKDNLGFMPHFSVSKLIEYRMGNCRDMTDAAVYIMRAVGIPVATDAVHKWPYKKNSHAWNVVFDKNGKPVTFMGMEQSPGTTNKPGTKKGKVYRKTFVLNPESLAMQKEKDDIVPPFFNDARIKDVTDEYVKTFDITIPLKNKDNQSGKYVYLSVFNSTSWVPIAWANANSEQAVFSKMEGRIAYLPTYYDPNKLLAAANFPLILDEIGKVHLLKPDKSKLHNQMVLNHMYPFIPDQFRVTKLWGGHIQGSNHPDFNEAVDLHIISDPMPFWNKVKLSSTERFRYIRYLPKRGYASDLSELELYSSGVKLKGKAIGSNGSSNQDSTVKNILDNNFATRFITKFSVGTWVGIDLGKSMKIESIRYAAGMNEKKFTKVISGEEYELYYWAGNSGWESIGKKVPVGTNVIYENVPQNALYLLKCNSKNLEARIFTYDKGRQIWW